MRWSTTTFQTSATVVIAFITGFCLGQLAGMSALVYAAITVPALIMAVRWDRKRLKEWLTWDGEL